VETLITLVLLIAGSALANWIKTRANRDQAGEWKELEDWVGRDAPETRSGHPVEPPPLVSPEPETEERPVFRRESHRPPPVIWQQPRPTHRDSDKTPPVRLYLEGQEQHELERTLAKIEESRAHQKRALQARYGVADRLRAVDGVRDNRSGSGRTHARSVQTRELAQLLRNPHSVRQAIAASIILGQPKSVTS
jgi:hypothetical protein